MKEEMFDYTALCRAMEALPKEAALCVTKIGKSILGRELPLLTLGKGKRTVLYVGGVHGTECESAALLMRFVSDYLQQLSRNGVVYEYSMRYLFEEHRICVLPMLNPDGACYVSTGVEKENPLRDRLVRMNGSDDFSAWEANGRGVDLGHNFDVDFKERKRNETEKGILNGAKQDYSGEYPESEPETAALCAFLRALGAQMEGVISFEMGDGDIYCDCKDNMTAKTVSVGRVLSRFTGYRLARPETLCSVGSLSDWCIRELHLPAFTLKCDRASTQPILYERLRRVLFSYPCMV